MAHSGEIIQKEKYSMNTKELKLIERRRDLLTDILGVGESWEGELLELPAGSIDELFTDFNMQTWCRCVGVVMERNTNPDPAFHSPTTYVFRGIQTNLEEVNDEEL